MSDQTARGLEFGGPVLLLRVVDLVETDRAINVVSRGSAEARQYAISLLSFDSHPTKEEP